MQHTVLIVIWALALFRGHVAASTWANQDYAESTFDLDQAVLTQVFHKRSLDDSRQSPVNHHTCNTWGGGALKTFANKLFYFKSTCDLFMSRSCKGQVDQYEVKIRRGPDGNLEHIFIKIEMTKIVLANGTIWVKDQMRTLPYDDKMVNIRSNGVNIRIANKKHSVSLIWNKKDALSLKLHPRYSGNTCGLCGQFEKKGRSSAQIKIVDAIAIRQHSVSSDTCSVTIPEDERCQDVSRCLRAFSTYFASCDDFHAYFRICAKDVCSSNNDQAHCDTLTQFAQLCPVGKSDWRSAEKCEQPVCPENQIYRECGSDITPTCTNPKPQQKKDICVTTCECQPGTVLDDIRGTNKCISNSTCPCVYSGMIYDSGDRRNTSCQTCVCNGGLWECSHHSCPSRCKVEGTHITTFDRKYYNLRGDCTYYAVFGNAWSVTIEMHVCQKAVGQICLRRVSYSQSEVSYEFNNNGDIYSGGDEIKLPLKQGGIIIFQKSSQFIQFSTSFGLTMQVQISPTMQLYISLQENHKGTVKGLCGNFNDYASDDFLSIQNIVEQSAVNFAHSWIISGAVCNPPESEEPTCLSSEKENYAKEHCAELINQKGAFGPCHSAVDYIKYYAMCKDSICTCQDIDRCICAALGAYVHACAERGVILTKWTASVCNTTCKKSQVFDNNMTVCNRTCRSLEKPDFTCTVKDVPVYGCGCPAGKYMDESGLCVDRRRCSCYYRGMYIASGESIDNCYCIDGRISCAQVSTTPQTPVCRGEKRYFNCSGAGNLNRKLCGKKCSNLNLPCPDQCIPGCVCPEGKAEDDSGNCVLHEKCPCLFEGESFSEGKVIKKDCNKCTCQGGMWKCTKKRCSKTCKVYGEGHFTTFDDKSYTFEGNCEYTFVQDHCRGKIGTFQILFENVACCEDGVTCSRNIRIIFQDKELTLEDGKIKGSDSNSISTCTEDSYSLHTVGLYLILTFSNGITVIWDKHTRLSVTLDEQWRNKVCGLCGNFNDDTEDDLTTKFNSLVSSSAEFGNSWKSIQSCSGSVNQTFPCERNPFCSPWAQRKCSIIKDPNEAFKKCHNKVNPEPYHEACIKEACACDMQGKYLGFCTAVAVYAEACNKAGVCVHWRTPERCPVYCDYYNRPDECSWHYQPCGTLTAKTCSDHSIRKKLSAVLEGCYPKCPEGASYLDENTMKCVNLDECTCYYNGKIYQPFETVPGCGNCVCSEGIVRCGK
ncbi:mucin-19-like [Rhincodon typus]|uniref:mucin-19-like n=1 Tax=Rhincodon typus TaxID=259920 RepID=UPI00202EF94F|nr:mucin-19-like [Rhincodon typus]